MSRRNSSLFTIIMEYRGGTYITQVDASDPESALKRWAGQIKPVDIGDFGEVHKTELLEAIHEWLADGQRAAAIMDTRNVWRHTQSIGGSLMLINVVATKKTVVPSSRKLPTPGARRNVPLGSF